MDPVILRLAVTRLHMLFIENTTLVVTEKYLTFLRLYDQLKVWFDVMVNHLQMVLYKMVALCATLTP